MHQKMSAASGACDETAAALIIKGAAAPDGGNWQCRLHHLQHLDPQFFLDTHTHPSKRVREVVRVTVPKS
jgi:hypothetical protein